MKRIIITALACMLACAASAQDNWFFPAGGKTNCYRTTASTMMGGQTLYSSIYVKEADGDNRTVVSDVFQNQDDAAPMQSVATIYRKSGDKWVVGLSETLSASLQSLGKVSVSQNTGEMVYPCRPEAGQTFDDIKARLSIDMQGTAVAVDAEVKERKVAGEESVEVPAGKFACLRFDETTVTSLMGQNIVTRSQTWIAKGVGVVKQKTDMMDGMITVVMELTEVKER